MVPGEIFTADKTIILNEGRQIKTLSVTNKGDRPIQVGSHFHFFEVNRYLAFDREKAFCMHLDIPSGTSVRFEPGEKKTVQLVALGGRQRVYGLNNLTQTKADASALPGAMQKAKRSGFSMEAEK